MGELAGGTCGWANLGLDERGEIYTVMVGLATFGRMPHAACRMPHAACRMPQALDRLVLGHMPRSINRCSSS
nr:hypothetical protein [Micromonospora endolithica]